MKKLKIFISSVQNEFAEERKELSTYLSRDPLFGTFFDPFLFEEVPATTHSSSKVYINKVKCSDMDINSLKEPHSSYPHNPLLAGCMFLTGDIERFGTGTVEMFNLTKEKGLKPPFISLEEGFRLTIWRPSAGSTIQYHTIPYMIPYMIPLRNIPK